MPLWFVFLATHSSTLFFSSQRLLIVLNWKASRDSIVVPGFLGIDLDLKLNPVFAANRDEGSLQEQM